MSDYIVPCLIAAILIHGICKKVNIYSALMEGAATGLKVCISIFPAVLIMLVAITMLRASGAVDLVAHSLTPILQPLGIPGDCIPLALLRPFSGNGALSVGSEIIRKNGPDSLAGRIAAVMMGSSETSFYTIGVYTAYIKMKNTRYALPAALSADLTAFIFSAIAVRLFMSSP